MENKSPFISNLFFGIGYLVVIAAVLRLGWDQPLRYLLLSNEEIAAIEHPAPPPVPTATPPPKPTPAAWMQDASRKNPLDHPGSGLGSAPRH